MPRVRQADTQLLALGRELERAWAAERSAIRSSARNEAQNTTTKERSAAIVDQIAGLPAVTLGGLRGKARAYSWTQAGDPTSVAVISVDGLENSEERVLHSILRD